MDSFGIIWNTAQTCRDEIIQDIKNSVPVLDIYDIDLGNNYENFVRDLYSIDEIDSAKLEMKLQSMLNNKLRIITIIFMKIDPTKQYYYIHKKRNVFSEIQDLKLLIRNKYKEKVENYFFDNVFHMSDDEFEYVEGLKILSKYLDNSKSNNRTRKKDNK